MKTSSIADLGKRQEVDITEDQTALQYLNGNDLHSDSAKERKKIKRRPSPIRCATACYLIRRVEWRKVPATQGREHHSATTRLFRTQRQNYMTHSEAMANTTKAQARQKKQYDASRLKKTTKRKAETEKELKNVFFPGNFVLMKPIGRSKGKPKSPWEGPFKVVSRHNEGRSINTCGQYGTSCNRYVSDSAPHAMTATAA